MASPIPSPHPRPETHAADRIGWLRAAVLGANDGIVSTSSLIVGIAATAAGAREILVAGLASLVAGAMSMAAGEYVSVSSQADAEAADRAKETRELQEQPELELRELAGIWRGRGLDAETAQRVAEQLTAHDALGSHLRDELGASEHQAARPLQAAVTSALTFTAGAAAPLLAAWLAPRAQVLPVVAGSSLAYLALLGVLGAWLGRSPLLRPTLRVVFWGAVAMLATAGVGRLFGTSVIG